MSHSLSLVCMFTAGSPYEREAELLAESAARFGHKLQAVAVPDQGDWWRNVGIKPTYVLKALEATDGPLLFLDSDCLILQPLDELMSLADQCDLAVKYRPGNCFSALFNAAVLLVKNTPATLEVVRTWAERGLAFSHLHRFSEQGTFAEGVLAAQGNLRFKPLPEKFHMFPREQGGAPPGCVILHNKTSRKVRRSALPEGAPQPRCQVSEDLHVIGVGPPASEPADRLWTNGILGANQDFVEYLSRHGVQKIFSVTTASNSPSGEELDLAKISAMRQVAEGFPPSARVILVDHDVVFLSNPGRIADALDAAELALVRSSRSCGDLPRTELIAFRPTPAIVQTFLRDLEQTYKPLAAGTTSSDRLSIAIQNVLDRFRTRIHVRWLPQNSISNLTTVTRETVVLSARGGLNLNQGEAKWPTLSLEPWTPQVSLPAR